MNELAVLHGTSKISFLQNSLKKERRWAVEFINNLYFCPPNVNKSSYTTIKIAIHQVVAKVLCRFFNHRKRSNHWLFGSSIMPALRLKISSKFSCSEFYFILTNRG